MLGIDAGGFPAGVDVVALPKRGNARADWEDAVALGAGDGAWRLAVADGATESSFAGLWARLLVERWVREPWLENDADAVGGWLTLPQRAWRARVGAAPLPWYAAEKAAQGAFAALVGLEIRPAVGPIVGGVWTAFAAGDCCLLHYGRSDGTPARLQRAFPVESAAEFSNRPLLLSSIAARNARLDGALAVAGGIYGPADRLALASDALAAWLLTDEDGAEGRFERLSEAAVAGEAGALIAAERQCGRLRNDDVALLLVDCGRLGPPESVDLPLTDSEELSPARAAAPEPALEGVG